MDTISAAAGAVATLYSAKETHNQHLKYNANANKLAIWKIY